MGLFLVAVARQGARAVSDPDAFWHLRLGHDIVRAHSVTTVTAQWSDLSDQHWVPTQWLTEVVLAAAESVGGLPAVAWLFTLSLLALVLVLHRIARHVADPIPAAFATGLAVAAMGASLSPRPHMVTYLFLALTVLAWHDTADDLRPRWWLVPLTWVWAMSHGMWFISPVVGLAVLAGLGLDGRLNRVVGLRLAAVPVGSLLVAALTPVGPALLQAPFAVAGIGAFITEWQPPSFRSPAPAAAALMVAIVVVTWARSTRRVPWSYIALLVLATGWILLATRTVAIGAVMVTPLLAAALQGALRRDAQPELRRERWTLRLAALAAAVGVGLVVPYTAAEPAEVPRGLDASLDSLGPTVVFNSYEVGGWLRWQHPDLEPVVDGMTEAYPVQHLQAYAVVQAAAPGWDEAFEEWSPGAALLPEASPLALALREQWGWVELDKDAGYQLLVPPGAAS
ncbi:hypothetical protein [Nocardioides sp. P5_E3]